MYVIAGLKSNTYLKAGYDNCGIYCTIMLDIVDCRKNVFSVEENVCALSAVN